MASCSCRCRCPRRRMLVLQMTRLFCRGPVFPLLRRRWLRPRLHCGLCFKGNNWLRRKKAVAFGSSLAPNQERPWKFGECALEYPRWNPPDDSRGNKTILAPESVTISGGRYLWRPVYITSKWPCTNKLACQVIYKTASLEQGKQFIHCGFSFMAHILDIKAQKTNSSWTYRVDYLKHRCCIGSWPL